MTRKSKNKLSNAERAVNRQPGFRPGELVEQIMCNPWNKSLLLMSEHDIRHKHQKNEKKMTLENLNHTKAKLREYIFLDKGWRLIDRSHPAHPRKVILNSSEDRDSKKTLPKISKNNTKNEEKMTKQKKLGWRNKVRKWSFLRVGRCAID